MDEGSVRVLPPRLGEFPFDTRPRDTLPSGFKAFLGLEYPLLARDPDRQSPRRSPSLSPLRMTKHSGSGDLLFPQ